MHKRDEHLQTIDTVLGLEGTTTVFAFEADLAANFDAMIADGYGADRFGDIFYNDHLSSLASRIQRIVEENPGFVSKFNALFHGADPEADGVRRRSISIRPTRNADGMGNKYYMSSFTPEGNLEIEYCRFNCNLSEIGADLPALVKTISRVNAAAMAAAGGSDGQPSEASQYPRVLAIAELLGIEAPEFIDVVGDFAELSDSLEKSGYEIDRFEDIFYGTFMENLFDNLKGFVEEDPVEFLALFHSRFASKKIVLQPFTSEEADVVNGYYQTSFSADGALLIKFRRNNVS